MAQKFLTPKDEFIRSLERKGRGITLTTLANKWGLNATELREVARNEGWVSQREDYMKKITYYTEDRSAKSIATKLAEINEKGDEILDIAMDQALNAIQLRYMFCQNHDCEEENPSINMKSPVWHCKACGNINKVKLTPSEIQAWAIGARGILETRQRIYGGDKIMSGTGDIDRSAFQEWINLYEWDMLAFAKALFPHLVPDYFCQLHIDSANQFKKRAGMRGFKEVIAAPRGYAKTTFDVTIEVIHDCVYGHEKFILICSSTSTLSLDKVKAIRDELESNALLKLLYGDMKGPKWNQDDFVCANGTRVLAISPKSQVRGLNDRGNRPTKIILDDAENSEHVQTMLQREKMEKWFNEDMMKLGTRTTNIKLVGTSLHIDALLEKLFKNAGFANRRYRAVIDFAEESAMHLWETWRNILVDISNPGRMKEADDWFEKNKEEMTRGSRVLWPERESYVDLMKMRLFEGNTAFQLEKQNNPLSEDRLIFDMEDAGTFKIGIGSIQRSDGGIVRFSDFEDRIVAFLDPVVGQGHESDFAACPIIAKDRHGYKYVLECYLKQHVSPSVQAREVVDLLWNWKVTRLGVEANGFQSLLVTTIKECIAAKALKEGVDWSVKLVPITNLRSKHVRISTMEPSVTNRWLWFSDDLPPEYFEQFRRFRPVPDAGFDDAPDATEGACRVIDNDIK